MGSVSSRSMTRILIPLKGKRRIKKEKKEMVGQPPQKTDLSLFIGWLTAVARKSTLTGYAVNGS